MVVGSVRSRVVSTLVLFAALAAVTPSVVTAQAAPAVLGKTMGEWSASWWQWAFAIPEGRNPLLDPDGTFCAENQRGPVWFLGGVLGNGTVERSCTIPAGKHILFPVANAFWLQTPLDDPSNTEQDYRELAQSFLPTTGGDLFATIDGQPVVFNPRLSIVRTQSPVFTAVFPADNIFAVRSDVPDRVPHRVGRLLGDAPAADAGSPRSDVRRRFDPERDVQSAGPLRA